MAIFIYKNNQLYILYKMNNIGIIVNGGLGNQIFKIFAVISYYIDNCQNYILYANDNGYRKYYWDTLFSNIGHKVLNETPILDKYTAPFFHYKERFWL